MIVLDAIDRRLIAATQTGLPLVAEPYRAIAEQLAVDESEVTARFERLLAGGAIRRMGAVPNHYALGIVANGMSVWDVPDQSVAEIGARIGAFDFVTHCYERKRHPPLWPYNLFAMVHGRSRAEVHEKVAVIKGSIGSEVRAHDILFSTRVLKKTGFRLAG
jgi:DNA-binding Lrp family transcriptional regulator